MERLLNQRPKWVMRIFAVLTVIILLWCKFSWVEKTFNLLNLTLFNASITMLGFTIAAVSIVMALRDNGLLKTLFERRSDIWKKMIGEFFGSIKALGIYSVFLIISSQLPISNWHIYIQYFMYFCFLYGFFENCFRVLWTLIVLENSSWMSSQESLN